jgi:hypothetical protein
MRFVFDNANYRLVYSRTMKSPADALDRAIAICGTQTELARRIEAARGRLGIALELGPVTFRHVWNWRNRDGGRIPSVFCRCAELATHGIVTRYDFRPDVFGRAPRKSA